MPKIYLSLFLKRSTVSSVPLCWDMLKYSHSLIKLYTDNKDLVKSGKTGSMGHKSQCYGALWQLCLWQSYKKTYIIIKFIIILAAG